MKDVIIHIALQTIREADVRGPMYGLWPWLWLPVPQHDHDR